MPKKAEGRARGRLSQEEWIRAAFEAIVEEGPDGLRIVRLARRLGVSTGSFYWHFEDRDELRDKLLRRWRQMLGDAADAAERSGAGPSKLRALPSVLGRRALPELDGAIREWGRRDATVAREVARADSLRIRRMEQMLRAAGLDEETAAKRAPLLLWAHVGSLGFDPERRAAGLGELVRILASAPPERAGRSPRGRADRSRARRAPPPE